MDMNRSIGKRVAVYVQALKDAGCSEVVLAINYQPKVRMPCAYELQASAALATRCKSGAWLCGLTVYC